MATSPLRQLGIAALAVLLFAGCVGEFDENVDCTDQCDDGSLQCGDDRNYDFDYEDYEGECPEPGAPEFCGTAESEDCTEPDFDLVEATVSDIHEALNNGDISCQWLTARYRRRILWHDLYMEDGDPPLNAFVHLNDDAMETARRLDEYQQCEGELAGPLHCVPFAIKSNYGSKEVPVTNGSLALMEPQPTFDAYTVEQLRAAGGLNLGSTAMDEFAASAQGLSGRSGKTGNAYDTTYTSGGSSAGSAVAVASNMTVGALGTDNCSSLTLPAAYNNLYTIRSSHQLVSTDGIFPTNRLDAVSGPLTRTAEDLILFFEEMASFNPNSKAHCDEDFRREGLRHDIDYTEALDEDALEGKTIGVLERLGDNPDDERRPFGAASPEVEDHFQQFFGELEEAGAEIKEGIALDELSLDRDGTGSGYDANRFLENSEGGASDYEAICETEMYSQSVFENKDECMNRAGQSAGNLKSQFEDGLETYESNRFYVESVMDEHGVDALVYPADRNGPPRRAYTRTMCILSSVTGLPTVILPTGFSEGGLPIGMSLTGRMFDDDELLAMAYAYDQTTDHRSPPEMPDLQGPPPVDAGEFEDLHYDVGLAAFEEVLRDEDKYNLDHQAFADIAEDVLLEWDLEEYVGEAE